VQRIPPVRSLNKQAHDPNSQSCDGIPVECCPIEGQPEQRIDHHNDEGRGMTCGLPDMCRPMFLGGQRRRVVHAIDVGMICDMGKWHGSPAASA
jgi:hypothetical protein